MDASTFGCFLLSLIRKYPEIADPEEKIVLVLDNASIHKAKKIKNLLTHLNILYLAPYSPFMNSIEEFFGLSKYYYRKAILLNSANLDKHIVKAFKKVK